MTKRVREDEHGYAAVEELCQSVKRLNSSTDQNQLPLGEPQKLPFTSLDHVEQPLLHRRQSLNDLTAARDESHPAAPLEPQEEPASMYEQANTMLRDLHFERVHRLGRSEDQ